jgi:hypothetical protein
VAPTTVNPAPLDGNLNRPRSIILKSSFIRNIIDQSPPDDTEFTSIYRSKFCISGLLTFSDGGTIEGRDIFKYKTSFIIYKEFAELVLPHLDTHKMDCCTSEWWCDMDEWSWRDMYF